MLGSKPAYLLETFGMKQIFLSLISLLALAAPCAAQVDWGKYSQSFPNGSLDKPATIALITAVKKPNDSFWGGASAASLASNLSADTAFQRSRPSDFIAKAAFDTAKAQFFLHGVNTKNAGDYQFRVIEGDNKIILPWGPVNKFTDAKLNTSAGLPQMAYLGGYKAPLLSKIIVDVRKKGSDKIIATAVVTWQYVKPSIVDVYAPGDLNIFLKRLSGAWRIKQNEKSLWQRQNPEDIFGREPNPPRKLIVDPADNNLVFYLDADIYNKEQIEYEVIKNNNVITPWKINDFDNSFVWLRGLAPGDYILKIRYNLQRQHVTSVAFEIKTPWYESTIFGIIVGILSASFICVIILFIVIINQRQKAKGEFAKKTKLQLELKAIYAQLNPHFVFNALSSIQGLINKQDIAGANNYLSDFAKLMRESLASNNKEQIPLKQEIEILDTYLKLEQLRFGFKYEIKVGEHIGLYETEIPTLLLQPIVENAVKHGVSSLQDKGRITISFIREDNMMLVSIMDNGPGFTGTENKNGFGLKLTRDRITLLNELTNEQLIALTINQNKTDGTEFQLKFTNWFL
jgi:hypothetical protein